MSAKALETWAWVLIYGGLLTLCLGVFMARAGSGLGYALCALGAVLAAAGAVLIVRRARLPQAPGNPPSQKE
jgi:hypothetical protein